MAIDTRTRLHDLIDRLDEPDLADTVAYVESLLDDGDTLTEEELAEVREGERQIARGESISLDDLARELGL